MNDRTTTLDCAGDYELVIRAQQSDEAAFGELMRRTSSASFKLAVSILRDRQEAEDEVQNSYLKAWRHVGQFQGEAKFSTWLAQIVVNQCLMRLRKLRAKSFVYLDQVSKEDGSRTRELTDVSSTPERSLGSKELSEVMQQEIRRLPPLLRHVLILRDLEEMSSAEVASRLRISTSAVKSRLIRARRLFRDCLERHGGRSAIATFTA